MPNYRVVRAWPAWYRTVDYVDAAGPAEAADIAGELDIVDDEYSDYCGETTTAVFDANDPDTQLYCDEAEPMSKTVFKHRFGQLETAVSEIRGHWYITTQLDGHPPKVEAVVAREAYRVIMETGQLTAEEVDEALSK